MMKLLDQVRDVLRKRHYSIRTEQAYVDWIKRYIFFITNAIRRKWEHQKFRGFSPTWQPNNTLRRAPRIRH